MGDNKNNPGNIDGELIKRINVANFGEAEGGTAASKAELEREEQALENVQLGQDIRERKKYADRIFVIMSIWLATTMLIVLCHGNKTNNFNLSGDVLMTLLGGTTLNVLGLFAIVANYLFPKQNQQRKNGKTNGSIAERVARLEGIFSKE